MAALGLAATYNHGGTGKWGAAHTAYLKGALVEALLSDRAARVQWVFVSAPLENRLLVWAVRHDRPRWLIEYARQVMRQPSAAAPHDDHFHVRVYCSRADRERGCEDPGPIWAHEKKTYKYGGPEHYEPILTDALMSRPMFFPANLRL